MASRRRMPHAEESSGGDESYSDSGSYSDEMDASRAGNENVLRLRALLRERMYRVQAKLGQSLDFLEHKMKSELASQLHNLVAVRLQDDFARLHEALDEQRKKISSDINVWKATFEPEILASVKKLEADVAKDETLLDKGRTALTKGNAYLLESTNVAALMRAMNAAVRRDTVLMAQALESRIDLSQHRAFRLDGVQRAIQRVYIARPQPRGGSAALLQNAVFKSQAEEEASLDLEQVQFVSANRLSWRKAMEKWADKFGDRHIIDCDAELMRIVRTLISQLTTDYPIPDEYVFQLFSKYERVPNLRKLKEQVINKLHGVFDSLEQRKDHVYDALRLRVDPEDTGTVTRIVFTSSWAVFIEKEIEVGLTSIAYRQKAKPIPLLDQSGKPSDTTARRVKRALTEYELVPKGL